MLSPSHWRQCLGGGRVVGGGGMGLYIVFTLSVCWSVTFGFLSRGISNKHCLLTLLVICCFFLLFFLWEGVHGGVARFKQKSCLKL